MANSAIAKVLPRGKDIKRLIEYHLKIKGQPRPDCKLIGGTIVTDNLKDLATLVNSRTKMHPHVKNPIWHATISLDPNTKMDERTLNEMAATFMAEMGFDDSALYKVALHDDKGHQHIHIAACRVMGDGSLYHGKKDGERARVVMDTIAPRFGLTPVPIPANRKQRITKAKAMRTANLNAKGILTNEQIICKVIDTLVDAKLKFGSYTTFCQTLEGVGIKPAPVIQRKDGLPHIAGMSFQVRQADGAVREYAAKKSLGEAYLLIELMRKMRFTFDPEGVDAAIIERQKAEQDYRKSQHMHPDPPRITIDKSQPLTEAKVIRIKHMIAEAAAAAQAAAIAKADKERQDRIDADKVKRAITSEAPVVEVTPQIEVPTKPAAPPKIRRRM